MAFSYQDIKASKGQTKLIVNINFLNKEHIHVYVNTVEVNNFKWIGDSTLELKNPLSEGDSVRIQRITPRDHLIIEFAEGAPFLRDNLDTQNTQFLFLMQETVEGAVLDSVVDNINMNGHRIINLGDAIDEQDGVNFRTMKSYIDTGEPEFINDLKKEDGLKYIGQCPDIKTLRTIYPKEDRQRIYVASYHLNTKIGGGYFYFDGEDNDTIDDGGYCIVTDKQHRWKRDIPIKDLTVLHFGAINDGEFDCTSAVTSMFNFTKRVEPSMGIRFASGKYFITKLDISKNLISFFSLKGVHCNFGYFPQTTIISDYEPNTLFTVQARRTEISDITFDGRINEQDNKKAFFKNTCPAGQFINIQRMWWKNVGGLCLHLLDTLDTYIGQFYANDCTGGIIKTNWTNTKEGGWYHVTAIELANFNIQKCTKEPVFDIQRATQCLMRNGWMEWCEFPGNISNGQWTIDTLCLEECKNPLYCKYANLVCTAISLQTGSRLDYDNGAEERWQSGYEAGHVHMENTGIQVVDGSFSANYVTHEMKFTNNTSEPVWYKIGQIHLSDIGSYAKLRLLGPQGFSNYSDNITRVGQEGIGAGEGIINLQTASDGYIYCNIDAIGSCPFRDVKYTNNNMYYAEVYVQFANYVRNITILCETNDFSRFNQGKHFLFNREATIIKDKDIAKIPKLKDTIAQGSLGFRAGFGWNNKGDILINGNVKDNHKLSVLVNGTQFYINLES